MPKEEWGTKRVCLTTGKRFYDCMATRPSHKVMHPGDKNSLLLTSPNFKEPRYSFL